MSKEVAKDLKLAAIEAKDEDSFNDIVAAFSTSFFNPDVPDPVTGLPSGQKLYAPEEMVKVYVGKYIRSVVSSYKEKQKAIEIANAGTAVAELLKAN